jgi:hypothetical protein
MAKIKDAAAIAEKWAAVTPQRSGEYQKGVMNPRTPWAAAATAGAANYNAGVTASIAAKSFERGIAAAGDAAWQKGASTKGPARFAEGVSIAQPEFQAGFAPYQQVISAVNLGPRYPTGDPRNLARVATMANALRAKKMGK